MKSKFLKLNVGKTEVLFIGKPQDHALYNMNIEIGNKIYNSSPIQSIKSLGAYLNGTMTMDTMISKRVQSCYYNLKKLGSIKRMLDIDERVLLVKSFILTKMDYCNILLSNVSLTCLRPLEKAFNACIRFIFNLKKRDHVTPYYREAHMLPTRYRIMFKTCVMVYKIINNLAPTYMNDFVVLHFPSEFSLRSNNDNLMIVQTMSQNTIQYVMIKNWNCLPYYLRSSESLDIFEKQLKTHYFTLAFP